MKRKSLLLPLIFLFIFSLPAEGREKSTCYGTTENGKIKNAWPLPDSGKNFKANSLVDVVAGRNYVHSLVYEVIVDAYKALEISAPNKRFVYGETGLRNGGRFKPHKTHQNGLSVDFFVPVINPKGESIFLPTGPLHQMGYAIEFDAHGKYQNYSIDFEAMGQHLLELKRAAELHHVKIRRVIFDNELQKLLFQSKSGKRAQAELTFSTRKPWVRHDEHYHVDFITNCERFR